MENKEKNQGINFNLKKFIVQCFRSWPIFVLSVIVCGGLAAFYAVVRTPQVEVDAQLLLKDDPGAGGSMMLGELARSFSLGDMFGGSSSTDNEAAVIRSHSVFLKTAKNLDLNVSYMQRKYGFKWVQMPLTSPVVLKAPAEMGDTINAALQFDLLRQGADKWDIKVKVKKKVVVDQKDVTLPTTIKTPYGPFNIEKTALYRKPESKEISKIRIIYTSYAAAAESYAQNVKVFVPDRKTDFIGLSFTTVDGKFGLELLDDIIRNYTDVGNIYKQDRSEQSLRLVNDRLRSLNDELAVSEHNLEKFKKDNNLTDVEADAQYLLTKTGEIESSLLQAQTQYEVVKLTKEFISNPANNYSLIPDLLMSSGAMSTSDGASSQISQYNEMILQRMQLLTTAKSNSPVVKQLDDQIDAMRKNIISSIDRLYQNSTVMLNDLKSENNKTQSRIGQLPTLEREYITLKRDNLLQEQMYLFLLQQREELNMSLASRSLPAQIIDAPHILANTPGLKTKMILIIGVFMGLLLAAAYVFLKKMKGAPITSIEEFDTLNEAPKVGEIKAAGKNDAELAVVDGGVNSEPFRLLRSVLQSALKNCDGKIVTVTSMHNGEGKTYVAVNLAVALAKLGKRVLLIDSAMRNPSVSGMLGISNAASALVDYVEASGKSALDISTVSIDKRNDLDVVTAKATETNASDVLGSGCFEALVGQLREEYDYIVIDASPIEGYSDVTYLTDISDVTVVVAKSNKITAADIDKINNFYNNGELKRLGVVTNAFK